MCLGILRFLMGRTKLKAEPLVVLHTVEHTAAYSSSQCQLHAMQPQRHCRQVFLPEGTLVVLAKRQHQYQDVSVEPLASRLVKMIYWPQLQMPICIPVMTSPDRLAAPPRLSH